MDTRLTMPALVSAILITAAVRPAGAEDNPHVWEPKVRSVAVFKNGLGFVVREGEVSLRNGWCLAEAVPPATFGTLAIYAHGENELVDVVGSGPGEVVEFDGIDAADDLASRRARLEGSRGLKVELSYRSKGTERVAVGTLTSVGPRFAVLDAGDNNLAVPVEEISKMQVLELPLRVHVSSDDGAPPERVKLGMAYLRKGLTWIPEYTLRILDDETAELTLRGTLVNEAEDLLKYVPRGGVGELPVTTAINIAHHQSETELERKVKTHEPSHGFFLDLVKLGGELKLRNFDQRPVDVIIDAPIPGRPLEASDGGSISVDTTKLKLLEREGGIRWRVGIDPDEEKVLSYVYERYVPSR